MVVRRSVKIFPTIRPNKNHVMFFFTFRVKSSYSTCEKCNYGESNPVIRW
jgi:hypothetical protein